MLYFLKISTLSKYTITTMTIYVVSNLCSRPLGELTQVGQTRTCQQNTLYKLIAKYVLVNVGSSHPESRGQLIPQDEILYPIMGSLPHPPPPPPYLISQNFMTFPWQFTPLHLYSWVRGISRLLKLSFPSGITKKQTFTKLNPGMSNSASKTTLNSP